ncbi:MAG: hypothetical protein HY809_01415 [Nitrospirae bacterium]|nr:hypothetical protein [Nitrospirota bacterium]
MIFASRAFAKALFVVLIFISMLTLFSACGRKGDPILIIPDEKAASDNSQPQKEKGGH